MNIKFLIKRLNATAQKSLQGAAGLCLWRTNYNVEIEHWLSKLSEDADSDVGFIFRHFGVDSAKVLSQLTKSLDRLQTGNARTPALAAQTVQLARDAWLLASIDFAAPAARTGHILCALLSSEELGPAARESAPELDKINPETLRGELANVISPSHESTDAAVGDSATSGAGQAMGGGSGALAQFSIDLTERARAGKIDPVLGRDAEVRQIVDILMRRRQNNPILTGEAGVGKTAVVEGLAARIAAGDVPPALRNVRLCTLDLGLLQAGAALKGEFESRLKSVIDEVRASPTPIILFIDEAHTIIGAGGQAGQGDAANLLKPALARGELRTVAATTWAEYKKYFEKDAALARRFQLVKIEEPPEAAAVEMLRGLVATMESHHRVRVLDEAIVEAVRLSHRYVTGRQLPDKAVAVLDTACARVAIGHDGIPAAIEDGRRRIGQVKLSIEILKREQASGANHAQRFAELNQELEKSEAELAALEKRWEQESALVSEIRNLRTELEKAHDEKTATQPAPENLAKLESLRTQLDSIQGENPLINACVDASAVAAVIAGQTGIPVGRMRQNEIHRVLRLREELEKRIVGQSHALKAVEQAVVTGRAKMGDPRRPIGVFLMVGTSGVGKTETAIALADLLYGGDQNMTTINMSEFKEEHKVSLLMGSPPGYVGYGEGGVLTEAVRRKPYSVLLLDEMEKAHPGVQDVFYQVFDKGNMRDGEGRDIDFKNTLIIMTSNAATDLITSMCADPDTMPEPAALLEAIYPELHKSFKPAFLGRCTVVPYLPLPPNVLRQIVVLKLQAVARRLRESYGAAFSWTDGALTHVVDRCSEVSTGARNIDNILTKSLLPDLSAEILSRLADGKPIGSVAVDVADNAFKYQFSGS